MTERHRRTSDWKRVLREHRRAMHDGLPRRIWPRHTNGAPGVRSVVDDSAPVSGRSAGATTRRLVLLGALLAAFASGWVGGAHGRWETSRALRATLQQNDLLEARAALLRARVRVYEGDLIDATRQLGYARAFVERAAPTSATTDVQGAVGPPDLEAAALEIDDAKRLVATLVAEARSPSPPWSPN